MPGEPFRSQTADLEKVIDLPTPIIGVVWSPSGKKVLLYSNERASTYLWEKQKLVLEKTLAINETIQCACWNPHNEKVIAFGATNHIIEWNIKHDQLITRIEYAHEIGIRCLDYNQNKPYFLASCGDDSMVRIWDTRNPEKAVLELSDHTHWIWSVQFNKYHDQLLLTCSSDSQVNLQSVVSVSSVPIVESDELTQRPVDGLVASFDQHEDSVYSVAWSPADPWIFASVSFDGRIVVNVVPQDHKYKIIL